MEKGDVRYHSFAEAAIEAVSPLTWSQSLGRLVVDEDLLAERGPLYARLYLQCALVLLCLVFVFDELWSSVSLTAQLVCMLATVGAGGFLIAGARMRTAVRSRRKN